MESESPTLREGDAFERPESEVALLHGLTMGCQWTISFTMHLLTIHLLMHRLTMDSEESDSIVA
jgi:hypothetical protein